MKAMYENVISAAALTTAQLTTFYLEYAAGAARRRHGLPRAPPSLLRVVPPTSSRILAAQISALRTARPAEARPPSPPPRAPTPAPRPSAAQKHEATPSSAKYSKPPRSPPRRRPAAAAAGNRAPARRRKSARSEAVLRVELASLLYDEPVDGGGQWLELAQPLMDGRGDAEAAAARGRLLAARLAASRATRRAPSRSARRHWRPRSRSTSAAAVSGVAACHRALDAPRAAQSALADAIDTCTEAATACRERRVHGARGARGPADPARPDPRGGGARGGGGRRAAGDRRAAMALDAPAATCGQIGHPRRWRRRCTRASLLAARCRPPSPPTTRTPRGRGGAARPGGPAAG